MELSRGPMVLAKLREPSLRHGVSLALLALVLMLAVALRLPATQRGLFHWDEAQFLFGVQPGVLAIREAAGLTDAPRPFPERPPFDTEKVPYWAFSAKPAYDLITTVYGVVMGLTPQSVGLLSFVFGVGTILAVYAIARRVFDEQVALASALVLSVSSYHVYYSGSTSPVVMSAFFLTLGVYLYLGTFIRPAARSASAFGRFALAGAVLACAYGAHYNLLLYVLAIFGFCGLRLLYDRKPGDVLGCVVMGLSFLAMIGLFELFYRIVIPVAYGHVPAARGAYLAQFRYQSGFFSWALPSGIDRFSRLLLDSEGLLVCALALVGWVGTVLRKWRNWGTGLLLLLAGAHFASATLGGAVRSPIFSRMTVAILPFLAIWAAVGLIQVLDVLRTRMAIPSRVPAFGVALLLVAVLGAPRARAVTTLRSGHEEQGRYVLEHGDAQQVSLGFPVDQYYLGSFQGTYGLPLTLRGLRELHQKTGVRLLVLDYRVNVLEEWGHPLGPVLREFERGAVPEVVIDNPIGAALVVVGEDAQSRQALARIFADPLSTRIRIYDLRKLLDGRFGVDAAATSGGQ